ncbi:MAG: GNAT family N-acetyltransferase [Alphaproteobacteria bacterium]|nr:GNAT family N-acetyltransferase [Alphaproteobacteria bacterium]
MASTLSLEPLRPEDAPAVQRWLHAHLRTHVRAWADVRGLGWTPPEADGHLLATDLVGEHWAALVRASRRRDHLVRVARLEGRPVGLAWAVVRPDDYLKESTGVLNWLFVDPAVRGHGLGRSLVAEAKRWMRSRGARSWVVSVLQGNEVAQAVYAASGARPADLRMMGSLEDDDG